MTVFLLTFTTKSFLLFDANLKLFVLSFAVVAKSLEVKGNFNDRTFVDILLFD